MENQTASHAQPEWLGWREAVGGTALLLEWSCQLSWKLLVRSMKDCGGEEMVGDNWSIHEGYAMGAVVLAQGEMPRKRGTRCQRPG